MNMNFLRRRRGSDSDSEESRDVAPNKVKSRKPPNTAFRQQRLKAWQPLLTPKSVIPLLMLIAVIFTALGIAIIISISRVEVLNVDYTHCANLNLNSFEDIPSKYTASHLRSHSNDLDFRWKVVNLTDPFGDLKQVCHVQFNLPHNIKPPIYLYYKLTSFYQNHRKYVESFDLEQLKGEAVSADDIASGCKPFRYQGSGDDKKIIYPCGLIANSLFNDTFSNPTLLNTKDGQENNTYILSSQGISWTADVKHKYKKTKYKPSEIVPPPNWYKTFPEGYNDTNLPDLKTMEHFQNWMRTAGLPSFYKLYGQNKTATLTSGTYEVEIEMNYPVSIFGGTKTMVITTSSVFGGYNLSLGIIYIIVAVVCLVCGIAFLLQHLVKPRKIGDHNYLANSNIMSGDGPLLGSTYRDQL